MTADEVIESLELARHPEGGWFRETWRDPAGPGERGAGTAIYFLLKAGERSHWHRVDACEIWHYHSGGPLTLRLAATTEGPAKAYVLGPNLLEGERPQVIVPKGHWQAAQSNGDWTLVSCTVSPAFEFDGFELARPGFEIPA